MYVPSGFGAGLKHQQALQDISGSVHPHGASLIGREALRQGDDLQRRDVLTARIVRADQAQYESSR
jgi:hypothetical protein